MKICFVVQGFGKKTDFTDGRVLDLDASYAIIKEAVEAAGLPGACPNSISLPIENFHAHKDDDQAFVAQHCNTSSLTLTKISSRSDSSSVWMNAKASKLIGCTPSGFAMPTSLSSVGLFFPCSSWLM